MKWWESPDGEKRLGHDKEVLAVWHPGLLIDVVGDRVEANGQMVIVAGESEIELAYAVRLVFPDDYPVTSPLAYDSGDAFPHTLDRHFFQSGSFCLWFKLAPRWEADDPDALLRFLNEQVRIFFLRQWLYDQGEGWTGPEYSHGWAAYFEYAEETGTSLTELEKLVPALQGRVQGQTPCPCGSGSEYGACHRDFIQSFRPTSREELEVLVLLIRAESTRESIAQGLNMSMSTRLTIGLP